MNLCKTIRMSQKMTQEDMAEVMNVTRQTIIRWEKEPESVPIASQVKLVSYITESAI